MNTGPEHMSVEFHNRATDLFFVLFHDFQLTTRKIDRKHDEFRFQQLEEQYVKTLHQQLDMIAKDILYRHRAQPGSNQSDQNLKQFIQDYLHRFVQKIRDM